MAQKSVRKNAKWIDLDGYAVVKSDFIKGDEITKYPRRDGKK